MASNEQSGTAASAEKLENTRENRVKTTHKLVSQLRQMADELENEPKPMRAAIVRVITENDDDTHNGMSMFLGTPEDSANTIGRAVSDFIGRTVENYPPALRPAMRTSLLGDIVAGFRSAESVRYKYDQEENSITGLVNAMFAKLIK